MSTDDPKSKQQLREQICLRLGYDDGLKGRQARFILGSDIDQIMQAFESFHKDTESYDTEVADNCRTIANADIPGEWVDPVAGKKLYNEAFHKEEVERAVREARIDENAACQQIVQSLFSTIDQLGAMRSRALRIDRSHSTQRSES